MYSFPGMAIIGKAILFLDLQKSAPLFGQVMHDSLENRDDDVKEYIPVKRFFAHLR